MKYVFDSVELDISKVELRRWGKDVPVEPQVFALLLLIVENHDRMVSRDEIIEKIWDGRIVSESAISSRIKAARRAIGDNGSEQRLIKTVHGRGYICAAPVRTVSSNGAVWGAQALVQPEQSDKPGPIASKPTIAILPFQRFGNSDEFATIADALPHELIAALSRLRWLMVIARGSAFRFRGPGIDVTQVGQSLGARYCLSGSVELQPSVISVAVELTDTRDAGVIWSECYRSKVDDIHLIRSEITAGVIAALELYVPLYEARVARMSTPENLDAWSHYHLGLAHMYWFNKLDNAKAAAHFHTATTLDPQFARAFAGLSFTSFQDSYLGYSADPKAAAMLAREAAERSLELDPLDPFGHFTMGRSYWLAEGLEDGLAWLERATILDPNYAQGHYAKAWANTMLGNGTAGSANVDTAMILSPLDPFLYAMKGTRAMSCLVQGRLENATRWIDEAAHTPGAHAVVSLVAAVIHALNGDDKSAIQWVKYARTRNPNVSQSLFFRSIPFQDQGLHRRAAMALSKSGVR
ncbi:MAG: winged helix-turn-helix domain-containing tetratricopeptide repeat protein [Hoeflea sp.]|uniref:winged helix-turn-helix domain-containing tetratricopeptide repeat protein n=1 Tax=Hoeflea sp. TaxID=1940281 RepID=UPI003EF81740